MVHSLCNQGGEGEQMTKGEALKKMQAIKSYMISGNPIWDVTEMGEAFDMAIEALESHWIQCSEQLPSAQPEIIRCKDCKWWRQQTNYQGVPLSFGFCESDDMWRSLYGETYEVSHIDTYGDFYCAYGEERRTDDSV